MGLFKRKKQPVIEDTRSDVEKRFEETGRKVGAKTGEVVQKGLDKIDTVKQKLKDDGTIDKVTSFVNKAEEKVDDFVEKATKKGQEQISKLKKVRNRNFLAFFLKEHI